MKIERQCPELGGVDAYTAGGRQPTHQQRHGRVGGSDPNAAADGSQQQTLGKPLANDSSTAGAYGKPNGSLLFPRCGRASSSPPTLALTINRSNAVPASSSARAVLD